MHEPGTSASRDRGVPKPLPVRRAGWTAILMALGLLIGPPAASAGPIGFDVGIGTTSAPAGGSGFFDIWLSNTGAVDLGIAAFDVEVNVATNAGLAFTGGDDATTDPYIFGTLQNGPLVDPANPLNPPTVTYNLIASDFMLSNATIGAGQTVGLARVTFSLAPWAAGPITVNFGATNFLDASSATLVPDSLQAGVVTAISSVPEIDPAGLGTVAAMVAAAAGLVDRRRRHRR